MITVVLDTNVLVSGACLPESLPGRLLRLWLGHRFDVALSEDILREFSDVMRRPKIRDRYAVSQQTVGAFAEILREAARIIPIGSIPESAIIDPADGHVLACAALAPADYIVTGDRHLLDLGQYRQSQIVTPARFYADLEAAG